MSSVSRVALFSTRSLATVSSHFLRVNKGARSGRCMERSSSRLRPKCLQADSFAKTSRKPAAGFTTYNGRLLRSSRCRNGRMSSPLFGRLFLSVIGFTVSGGCSTPAAYWGGKENVTETITGHEGHAREEGSTPLRAVNGELRSMLHIFGGKDAVHVLFDDGL